MWLKYANSDWTISYNTIYKAIYTGMFDKNGLSHGNKGAIRKLRHRDKSHHAKDYVEKRGKIPISNDLKDRPEEVNSRSRTGDWEGDTFQEKPPRAYMVTYGGP